MASENDSILSRLEKWATEQPGNSHVMHSCLDLPSSFPPFVVVVPLVPPCTTYKLR